QLGGYAINLAWDMVRLGERESIEDVAKNLSRWVNIIILRTYAQTRLEKLANSAHVPVINALTDEFHPCQALAMMLTLNEHLGKVKGKTVCFVGDGNNVASSHMIICSKLGVNYTIACPENYSIDMELFNKAKAIAKNNNCRISQIRDPFEGVKNADLIYTDTWASMGQEKEQAKRKRIFAAYQVNKKLMQAAPGHALVSHCMPAHRGEEITSEVIDGRQSIAFDEAENRLHVQKGVILFLLGKASGSGKS
ncbi:MAG: ornithine carbamoyltransferase, partial [bacterium]